MTYTPTIHRIEKYRGAEKSLRFITLINRAVSEDIICMSRAAELSNKKLADFRKEYLAV